MSETRQRLRGPAASDDEVKEFVRRIFAEGAQPAKTRLLHQLRESETVTVREAVRRGEIAVIIVLQRQPTRPKGHTEWLASTTDSCRGRRPLSSTGSTSTRYRARSVTNCGE